jgi:hypothetical protein
VLSLAGTLRKTTVCPATSTPACKNYVRNPRHIPHFCRCTVAPDVKSSEIIMPNPCTSCSADCMAVCFAAYFSACRFSWLSAGLLAENAGAAPTRVELASELRRAVAGSDRRPDKNSTRPGWRSSSLNVCCNLKR